MRAHVDFVLALHRELPADGNLCWSPYSVAAAMGLAAAGARGPTHEELARALAPGGTLTELGRMLSDSASLPEAELAVANRLWTDLHIRFREDYQQAVFGLPGGAVYATDFRGDAEGSRVKINDDVEQVTRGLIKELLARGMVGADTAAVIVNALYLKVAWLNAFPEPATAPAPFHAPAGVREVPTMRLQERFRYATAPGWRMVTMPTAGSVVVDVLLPEGDPVLPPAGVLAGLQDSGRSTKVDLALPRFRVDSAAVLNDPLAGLGVVSAFSPEAADFSGITETERIFIDLVMHKAVLRVDEQGFEGAAATAVVMRLVSMDMSDPVPFHADRPFLVLVRNPRTGAVYFVARVTEP